MRAMHLATMAGAAIWVHAAAAQSPMLLRSGVASNPTPIQHIIVIMQENRSFDSYFGTYPGANGIPAGVCVPLAVTNPSAGCVVPFHNPLDINQGGPHGANNATGDIDDGVISQKMDGFVTQQIAATKKNRPSLQVTEGALDHDVMGYHTAAEIPNYWTYAQNFVLQDNLFASERGWSLPNHLYLASEWSAICKDWTNAMTCASSDGTGTASFTTPNGLPWVNLFQLFDQYGVSWKYYLGQGTEPDCEDDAMTCAPVKMIGKSPSMWNAPPWFHYVKQQGPAYLDQHNPSLDQFLVDVGKGSLPQVSWLVPSGDYSEHPASGITVGMEYVTSAVNAVMQSPYWANTVIFISWDDWGGFYDHVPPPSVTAVAAGENLTGY